MNGRSKKTANFNDNPKKCGTWPSLAKNDVIKHEEDHSKAIFGQKLRHLLLNKTNQKRFLAKNDVITRSFPKEDQSKAIFGVSCCSRVQIVFPIHRSGKMEVD